MGFITKDAAFLIAFGCIPFYLTIGLVVSNVVLRLAGKKDQFDYLMTVFWPLTIILALLYFLFFGFDKKEKENGECI